MKRIPLALLGLLLAGLLPACSGRFSKTVVEGRADGISGSPDGRIVMQGMRGEETDALLKMIFK